jgi:hypothetical protein
MASFFTTDLAQAWNDRKLELKMERFQTYNDLLYAHLTEQFTRVRPGPAADMRVAIDHANSPSDLFTPVYTYDYRWTVQDMTDKYPMSYYAIIKHTDLLDRLSLFFGGRNFVVRQSKLDDTRYQLVLHYYPDGVNEQQTLHMERCARDHVGREQVFVRDIEWYEGYAYRQEGGYATPPRTRVAIAPPPPPPARPGYVRDYASAEAAARDLGEELLRECYCQHDSDSE